MENLIWIDHYKKQKMLQNFLISFNINIILQKVKKYLFQLISDSKFKSAKFRNLINRAFLICSTSE